MARQNYAEALRVAREALRFYDNAWVRHYIGAEPEPSEELLEDGGQQARVALDHISSLMGED